MRLGSPDNNWNSYRLLYCLLHTHARIVLFILCASSHPIRSFSTPNWCSTTPQFSIPGFRVVVATQL
jgi:hypothetical protein